MYEVLDQNVHQAQIHRLSDSFRYAQANIGSPFRKPDPITSPHHLRRDAGCDPSPGSPAEGSSMSYEWLRSYNRADVALPSGIGVTLSLVRAQDALVAGSIPLGVLKEMQPRRAGRAQRRRSEG